MTALHSIILFVTTVCIRIDEKTDMIMIYGECNKNVSAVARLCRQ
jgi:hypothetical protein